MATEKEYAALAAHIYNDQRGGGDASPSRPNMLDVPLGWSKLDSRNGFPAQTAYDENFFSFTAGAYVNAATGEIVVAYKGTDLLVEFSGRAWNTVGDITTDLAAGIGGVLSTAQFVQAATYYQEVKKWAADNGYDSSRISFTGHSLGAGIASVMTAWFNRPSTVFAVAPFELTASSALVLAAVGTALAAKGTSDVDFIAFVLDSVTPGTPLFYSRQDRVTNYFIKGEFLNNLRFASTTIFGSTTPIDIGAPPLGPGESSVDRAVALHSMNLHAALLFDDGLRALAITIPELIPALLNPRLYQADPNGAVKDLITALVNDQIRQGLAANSALKRFTSDLLKLDVADGTAHDPKVRTGLISAAMEYYYFKAPADATALFTTNANAIHFKYSDIGASNYKSLPKLVDAVQTLIGENTINAFGSPLIKQDAWHLQSGDASMTWTATGADNDGAIGGAQGDSLDAGAGDDVLYGLGGADTLKGGAGLDFLYGGDGGDTLDGGDNSDWLTGGQGSDTYRFIGSFGHDTVEDSDGQGTIEVDGIQLTGGKKILDGVYKDDATGWTYAVLGSDLILRKGGSANQIQIKDWTPSKNLGITFDDTVATPETSSTFTGDFRKETNPEGTRYTISDGNYVSGGVQAGAPDLITGTSAGDSIVGLGGDDALLGRAGDDYVDGGTGNDVLQGGLGADTLVGGDGRDIFYGSSTGSLTYPIDTDFTSPSPALPIVLGQGFNWVHESSGPDADGYQRGILSNSVDRDEQFGDEGSVIDAGAGDDIVFAGTGNDFVSAGEDNDDVYGMGGSDAMSGDEGNDRIYGDGPIDSTRVIYAAPADHGADVIDGGAGNDLLIGQGQDDALYGGSDSDTLYGDDRDNENTPPDVHGVDYLDGGDGNDKLIGGGRDDDLWGGEGNDSLWGDAGAVSTTAASYLQPFLHGDDYLDGEGGNDYLQGEGGDDTLFGGQGADTLIGDDEESNLSGPLHGADYLDGEEGDDALAGFGGNDTLFGGANNDYLDGDSSEDIVADDAHGDDYLDGEAGNDTLVGRGGDDAIFGGDGDDKIDGDSATGEVAGAFHGDDYLDGEDGADTVIGEGGADQIFGGSGNDQMRGDDGTQYVAGEYHGSDALDGEDGDDRLLGDGGNDTLIGGAGNDYLHGDANTDELAASFHGNDQLSGGDGADTLLGGGGNDDLNGGDGTDVVLGGDGNDRLVSDGFDYLNGGAGDDSYEITTQSDGTVAVIDDNQGVNTVFVNGAISNAASVFVQGGQTYLDVGAAGVIALGHTTALDGLVVESGYGGPALSAQAIVDATSIGGLVRSARWSDTTGTVWTRDITTAQNLRGGDRAEWLEGGTGLDELDAGAGDDRLDGGAGADHLMGGTGADTLRGGAGDDVLDAGSDVQQDVYTFARGDGTDLIRYTAAPEEAAKDIIRFDAGVTPADVSASIVFSSNQADAVPMISIAYGDGDRIVLQPGAEGSIDRLEFADGTILLLSDLLAQISDTGTPTQANDLLVGTDGDDWLRGLGGDDTLQGGAGHDLLDGGAGTNTYRFNANSGIDLITPTPGERALLVFDGLAAGDVVARIEQGRLILLAGESTVQVTGFSNLDGAAQTWQVQVGSEAPVSVASLLASSVPAPGGGDHAGRRDRFLAEQRVELRTLPQRLLNDQASVPTQVVTTSYSLDAPGTLQFQGHLNLVERSVTVVRQDYVSIYQTASVLPSDSGTAKWLPLQTGPLPPGAIPVTAPRADGSGGGSPNDVVLIGHFVPGSSGGATLQDRIVGYQWVKQSNVVTLFSDTAVQTQLIGTSGADVFEPDPNGEGGQFRGSIEAGAGNDQISLSSYGSLEDWGVMPAPDAYLMGYGYYERGRGAWVDAGEGDDTVLGTDGADVIVGGRGSDSMDGQAGADTYIVGIDAGSLDHIGDVARFTGEGDGIFLAYGGKLADQHQDTVEFDASVDRAQLGYRWSGNTLQLTSGGTLFLEIDYDDGLRGQPGAGGVERFVFADGVSFGLDELLAQLPEVSPTGTDGDDVLSGTSGDDVLDGKAGNDVLDAGAGNDLLDGGTGADTMTGGSGDDQYLVDDAVDQVLEDLNTGIDRVTASINYVLPANVEALTLTGSALEGTGNTLNNTINGNTLANMLDGAEGADIMTGGAGDDRYHVDEAADVVNELTGEGNDTVYSTVTHALAADVENLIIEGNAALNGTGNAGNNVLVGNTFANTLSTGDGADILAGGQGNDTLDGGAGDDLYLYNQGDGRDTITDVAGADILRFGSGITIDSVAARNVVVGGQTKVFLSILGADGTEQQDQGIELAAGGGTETFQFANGTTATLADLMIGARSLNGSNAAETLTGDRRDDTINAGVGADIVYGRTGNDKLYGGVSNDKLFGEGGNDQLYGETEADDLWGGAGNDLLDGSSGNDRLFGGTGDDNLNGRVDADLLDGGAGNDVLIGDSGQDELYAGDGNDNLSGGTDADLLAAGAGNDTIDGGSGTAVVVAGTGNDQITVGTNSDFIDAGAGNDTIVADFGADFIAAGRGSDSINAGGDADVIAFNRGDGADTFVTSSWQSDTLSLGGGIRYADLVLRKVGNDLVLDIGAGDSLTFKDWYLDNSRRNITRLQMVTGAEGGDYDATSSDRMRNKKAVSFNFDGLVARFDQLRAANQSMTSWAPAAEMNTYYQNGSNTQAIGGDLAWRYATSNGSGSYGDLGWTAVLSKTGSMSATTWQNLTAPTGVDPWTALQAGISLVPDQTVGLPSPITPVEPLTPEQLATQALSASLQPRPSWMQP